MHELSLAESVMRIIEDEAIAQQFRRVRSVTLEIGKLSAGFVLATAALHATGITAALLAKNRARAQWLRLAGAAIALCGGILFMG